MSKHGNPEMAGAEKPLPLRSKTDKPILKYNTRQTLSTTSASAFLQPRSTTPTQPVPSQHNALAPTVVRTPGVPLFSQVDLHYLKQQVSQFASPTVATNLFGASSPFSYRPQLLPAYTFLSSNSTTAGMVESSPHHTAATPQQPSTPKSTHNPYARPLSAKDLQQDQMYVTPTALLGASSVLIRSGSNSSVGSGSGGSNSNLTTWSVAATSPSSSPVVQTNSFLRPESVMQMEPKSVRTSPPRTTSVPISNHQTIVVETRQVSLIDKDDNENSPFKSRENSPVVSQSIMPKPPAASKPSVVRPSFANPKQTMESVRSQPRVHSVVPSPSPDKDIRVECTGTPVTRSSIPKPGMPHTYKPPPSSIPKQKAAPSPPTTNLEKPNSSATYTITTKPPGNQFSNLKPSMVMGNPIKSDSTLQKSARNGGSGSSPKPPPSARVPNKPPVPKSASSVRSSSSSSNASSVKVRNMNYTPAKPYNEVCDPDVPKVDCDINANIESYELYKAGQSDPNSNAHCTQMPNGAQTNFYRKYSKAEEVLHDLKRRPRADGAPSRAKVLERKASVGDQNELEDGEEGYDSDYGGPDSDSTLSASASESDSDVSKSGTEQDESDSSDNGSDSHSERLPGDGEDYDDDDDDDAFDDEDDVLDDIEDDDAAGSDDESDGVSLASRGNRISTRMRSATKRLLGLSISDKPRATRSRPSTAKSRPMSAISAVSSDNELLAALTPSLFSHIPPTINFVGNDEKVEQLPWEIRRLLKWRMSPITPNVVKNCIARSYFRPSKKSYDWLGYWGKHMKAQGFRAIREYQKMNHFPGSFQIGRKDKLWRNLSRLQVHFGKREFSFFPQTFVLPFDLKLLKRAWEDGGNKQKWIIKPPASARGIGIKVIHKWNQIPKRRPVIVQKYLSRPYLINESKFDLRIYVYVTCYDPLRIYVYQDGLVRFASTKYSHSLKNLNNRYMHLTNYSINKKNNDYQSNSDQGACQGHKWTLRALWGYLKKKGVDTNKIWESIIDLIVKTIISSEACVNSLVKANLKRRYSCHELFGFDIMLDDCLKPWIIEVNISPSLHSNSSLDIEVKGGMIKDLLNLAGFMIPPKNEVVAHPGAPLEPSRYQVPSEICVDKRMYPAQMSPDERAKHAYYCQRHTDEVAQQTILDILTPDDLRIMVDTLDEDSRRGDFIRVIPSPASSRYLRFFEQPRYYNLLMDAWVQRYHRMEARGVALLESFCQRGMHLENPTDDPRHQWSPPMSNNCREQRVVSAPGLAQAKLGAGSSLPSLRKKKLQSPHASSSSLCGTGLLSRQTTPSALNDASS